MRRGGSEAQARRISDRLAAISGLDYDRSITGFEHDTSRVEYIDELAKQKLIPTIEDFRKKYPELLTRELEAVLMKYGRPKEELRMAQDGPSVMPLLGTYYWQENRAVVYDLNCLLVACQLDLDYESIKEIVAAHEIAHAMTHIGKYGTLYWMNYVDREEHDSREFFAQAYAWFFSKNEPRLASVMIRLSETQSHVYRQWEPFMHSPPEEINGILRLKMLQPRHGVRLRGVMSGKVPGKNLEYELLRELINHEEQRFMTIMEEAERTKSVRRKALDDIKRVTELLSDVVFWDFPEPRMSGVSDSVTLKLGKSLRIAIESQLEGSLRSLEYQLETKGIRVIEE